MDRLRAVEHGFRDPSLTPAFNPNLGPSGYATAAQITTDLTTLYNKGWQGIITYTTLEGLNLVPAIALQVAKDNGYSHPFNVIVGIYYIQSTTVNQNDPNIGTEAAQELTNAANLAGMSDVVGFDVGNKGLFRLDYQDQNPSETVYDAYTYDDLQTAINQVTNIAQNKPVTTTEPSGLYLNGSNQWVANMWPTYQGMNIQTDGPTALARHRRLGVSQL